MDRKSVFRRSLLVLLACSATLWLPPARMEAMAPKHHLDAIMGPLEAAGFSEGSTWLVAYFAIEIDMPSVDATFCWSPIRWHTQRYACAHSHDPHPTWDPCEPGHRFADWVDWCLPFHNSRTPYPIAGWSARPAVGLDTFTQMRRLWAVHGAMHMAPGERCFDVLRRFGYMLHSIQDFYAHTNWVEVFHMDLDFPFEEIPTWTSFQRAQRGEKLNLILKRQARAKLGKSASEEVVIRQAEVLYDTLDANLRLGISEEQAGYNWHDRYGKDEDSDGHEWHEENDTHGHDILDFFEAAKFLAGTETYQLALEFRSNVVNNPRTGQAAWKNLFTCVEEMAAYDGISPEFELEEYVHSILRLKTYADVFGFWQ